MNESFYRAFEDRFRGSRDDIKERLKIYLPFVLPFKDHFSCVNLVDLGCGRGEWLELMSEYGFEVEGVDLDKGMLSACKMLECKVHIQDALEFLKSLPSESKAVITGFQIAEHVPFEYLKDIIEESKRILVPGGVFILETPNPENIIVGSSSFYMDPYHQRPLPPPLLDFLIEYCGFKRRKVLRLQEIEELKVKKKLSVVDVLKGPSPDYAVVSQKDGSIKAYELLDISFKKEYGLTLDMLSKTHQEYNDSFNLDFERRLSRIEKYLVYNVVRKLFTNFKKMVKLSFR